MGSRSNFIDIKIFISIKNLKGKIDRVNSFSRRESITPSLFPSLVKLSCHTESLAKPCWLIVKSPEGKDKQFPGKFPQIGIDMLETISDKKCFSWLLWPTC